jgi:hypothetical protein
VSLLGEHTRARGFKLLLVLLYLALAVAGTLWEARQVPRRAVPLMPATQPPQGTPELELELPVAGQRTAPAPERLRLPPDPQNPASGW